MADNRGHSELFGKGLPMPQAAFDSESVDRGARAALASPRIAAEVLQEEDAKKR